MTSSKVETSTDCLCETVTSKQEGAAVASALDEKVTLRHTKPDSSSNTNFSRQTSQQHHESSSVSAWDLEDEILDIVLQHLLHTSYTLPVALLHSRHFISDNLANILTRFNVEQKSIIRDVKMERDNVIRIDESELTAVVLQCLQSKITNYAQHCSLGDEFPSVLSYSAYACRNGRRKMEDRHVIVPNLRLLYNDLDTPQKAAYFAVFDGHGGKECASYAAVHLLSDILNFLRQETSDFVADRFSSAITDGFLKCDSFLQHKCKSENLKSGTTAACVFIFDQMLYLAWLGDSQILLVDHPKKWAFFSRKHDTKDETECSKIIARNGFVLNILGTNRVNGVVNITRSLGDQFLKPPLSAEPEIHTVPLTGQELFVILGSDGLWDGLSADDCTDIIADYCKEHECVAYENMAQHLVEKAQSSGVTDNVTAVVLFMQPLISIKAAYCG